MVGRGVATVSSILPEVCQVLLQYLWAESISSNMAKSREDCCWVALDGCHIPIKCPPGGLESCKEYHNSKKKKIDCSDGLLILITVLYEVLAVIRGNSHDSIIFRSTNLWNSIQDGLLPNVGKAVGEENVLLSNELDKLQFIDRCSQNERD